MSQYVEDFDAKARTWEADPAKLDRAQRVAAAIAAQVGDLARARVLEYGAGTGLLGFALLPRAAHVTLADVSEEMLAVAREKIRASHAENIDAIRLDLAADDLPGGPVAGRFDLVCTLMTLHHIRDVDAMLGRFCALLNRGGALCVCDLDSEDGSFHGPGFQGHNGFDRAALAKQIARAGLGPPSYSTACEIAKETPAGTRSYPLFLAVARKQ